MNLFWYEAGQDAQGPERSPDIWYFPDQPVDKLSTEAAGNTGFQTIQLLEQRSGLHWVGQIEQIIIRQSWAEININLSLNLRCVAEAPALWCSLCLCLPPSCQTNSSLTLMRLICHSSAHKRHHGIKLEVISHTDPGEIIGVFHILRSHSKYWINSNSSNAINQLATV